MTIENSLSQVVYVGDGIATQFPFSFIVPSGALVVEVFSDGAAVELTTSQYSVVGLGNPAGGTVTLPSPLPAGDEIIITRQVPFVQETEIQNQQRFFPQVVEDALDYLTMQTQQLKAKVNRAVLVRPGQTPDISVEQIITARDIAQTAADTAVAAAAGVEFPVSYAPQALTASEQAQVRANAGIPIKTPADFGIVGDVLIPTHFPTLQAAIDAIGPYQPADVILMIEDGHALSAGLKLTGGDYSKYKIRSEYSPVALATGFVPVLQDGKPASPQRTAIIIGYNTMLPALECLIDAGHAVQNGYAAVEKSDGFVARGCGVDNVRLFGIYARECSRIFAEGALARNSIQNGIYANRGSTIYAFEADASGCGQYCFNASRQSVIACGRSTANNAGASAGLAVHPETVSPAIGYYAAQGGRIACRESVALNSAFDGFVARDGGIIQATRGCDASGAGSRGFYAHRNGIIAAERGVADNCGTGFYANEGGTLNASEGSAVGCATHAVRVEIGGTFTAFGAFEAANAGNDCVTVGSDGSAVFGILNGQNAGRRGINAERAKNVVASGSNLSGAADHAVFASYGSRVIVDNSDLSGAGDVGAYAFWGGNINARNSNISGAGSRGVWARGGDVNAQSANAQRGASPGVLDITINEGGIVRAQGSTGGFSNDADTVTASGIIFS